jgi:hypothetical protein
VPESIGQLTKLTKLDLSNNRIAEIPEFLLRLNIAHLDVSNQTGVLIKTKPLESPLDYLFVVVHVVMGYADLVTDVLSIVQFEQHGQTALMGLNLAFLLFNVCVDAALMEDWKGRVLSVLQVQQAVQAVETLQLGKQTQQFVRGKKVDAVCRSVPSVVLQLYGLLVSLPSLGAKGALTISFSVVCGVVGAALTLGSLAEKAGNSMFSYAFSVHFCYYVCELAMRLVSMSLLFVSIGPIAFAVLAVDFLARLFGAYLMTQKAMSITAFTMALLLFGSDAANGPAEVSLFFSSTGSGIILLISLCLANLLGTPVLSLLRSHPGHPLQALTALACVAWLFKYLIGRYIWQNEFKAPLADADEEKNKGQKEQQHGQEAVPAANNRRASFRVSFEETYGGSSSSSPAPDRIPRRLQPQPQPMPQPKPGPGPGQHASVKIMHDNPLRLSDAV